MNKSQIKKVFEEYYNYDKNFMTPNVYGYDYKQFGDEFLLVEKSTGEGFDNEPIYGASTLILNSKTGEVQKIDLSEMYHDPRDVEIHVLKITPSKFESADRYGEIKKLVNVNEM